MLQHVLLWSGILAGYLFLYHDHNVLGIACFGVALLLMKGKP